MIVCLSVKRIIPEPTYKDLQEQVYEDFKMKYTRTPIFSFQSNEASALDHFATIIFPVYSVEVELHVKSKRCANLLLGLLELIVFSLRIP
jgi:hypothetical protein